jgi:hypothetical protein
VQRTDVHDQLTRHYVLEVIAYPLTEASCHVYIVEEVTKQIARANVVDNVHPSSAAEKVVTESTRHSLTLHTTCSGVLWKPYRKIRLAGKWVAL